MLKIQHVRRRIIMAATPVFVCVSLTICCLFIARHSKGKIKVKSTRESGSRAPLIHNLSVTWTDWSISHTCRFTVEKMAPFFMEYKSEWVPDSVWTVYRTEEILPHPGREPRSPQSTRSTDQASSGQHIRPIYNSYEILRIICTCSMKISFVFSFYFHDSSSSALCWDYQLLPNNS